MKTVSRKPCINREDKSNILLLIYTVISVTRTMKFLSVGNPCLFITVDPLGRHARKRISHR